jgi:hypothetical protein
MLTATARLQPRSADIASKVMDGEAIIINLANGIYYSLDKAGGLVWEQVAAKRTVAETVAAVASRYDVSPARAQSDVERLLAELIEENLVEPCDGEPASPHAAPAPTPRLLAYEPPTLAIYRDMGDLLALDPPTPGLDSPWQDAEEARP